MQGLNKDNKMEVRYAGLSIIKPDRYHTEMKYNQIFVVVGGYATGKSRFIDTMIGLRYKDEPYIRHEFTVPDTFGEFKEQMLLFDRLCEASIRGSIPLYVENFPLATEYALKGLLGKYRFRVWEEVRAKYPFHLIVMDVNPFLSEAHADYRVRDYATLCMKHKDDIRKRYMEFAETIQSDYKANKSEPYNSYTKLGLHPETKGWELREDGVYTNGSSDNRTTGMRCFTKALPKFWYPTKMRKRRIKELDTRIRVELCEYKIDMERRV